MAKPKEGLAFTIIATALLTISLTDAFVFNLFSTCNNSTQAVIKMAVSLAKHGEYNEVKEGIKTLENYHQIMPTLVSQLYDGNISNTKHTLELFDAISCEAYGEGLDTLYSKMKEHGNLESPEVLMVQCYVAGPDCMRIDKVKQTTGLLKPLVKNVLDRWAIDIQQGHYRHIYDLEQTVWDSVTAESQETYMLKRVFTNNPNSFNTTMDFVNGLHFHQSIVDGYLAIMDQLQRRPEKIYSQEMLTMSYWIHYRMKNWANLIISKPNLANSFTKLNKAVPVEIRNLFWTKTCSIKNLHWNEYLYATNKTNNTEAGGNGAVFTWIPGNKLSAGMWALESEIKDGLVYFNVKNKYHKNVGNFYLCSRNGKPMTCSEFEDKNGRWYLNPTVWQGKTRAFQIKNSEFNGPNQQDYLQGAMEHNLGFKRREVKDSVSGESSYWKVDCF